MSEGECTGVLLLQLLFVILALSLEDKVKKNIKNISHSPQYWLKSKADFNTSVYLLTTFYLFP